MRKLLTILLLCSSLVGLAQPTVSRPVAGAASTSSSVTYSLSAFTPTANSLLVLFVGATFAGTSGGTDNPFVTGGGLTWTLQQQVEDVGATANDYSYYIFTAQVGASPTSTTITFSNDNAVTSSGCNLSVLQFVGHDQSNPIVQIKANTTAATSTNANITFNSALSTGNAYAIAFMHLTNSTTVSSASPTGWTESEELAYNTPAYGMVVSYRSGGATTTGPYTWTSTSSTWTSFGIEIRAQNTVAKPRRINQLIIK